MRTENQINRTEQTRRDGEPTRLAETYTPAVDILETDEELMLQVDMPGVKPDDIDIEFEQGALTIAGRVEPRQRPETEYLLCEYGVGTFERTFRVSEAVDASRISAQCADGVLTVHLPKTEAVKPRKIKVEAK